MPCYHPLTGWRSKVANESGKRSITFNRNSGFTDLEISVPCGMCIGCRLMRSRDWALRCVHEASLYDENCFITLTYSDEHLPSNGSLVKKDLQKFLKRLRKKYDHKIRFYACGEYGEENLRPHYHACLFNHDFHDKEIFRQENGNWLYTSDTLSDIWGLGHCILGDVTFDSAAYVARYIMKKVLGPHAEYHYDELVPEFNTMSRRPGIAADWFAKFKTDLYPKDFITFNGKKMRVPKYYDQRLDLEDPGLLAQLKARRSFEISELDEQELMARRLQPKEFCQAAKLDLLPRSL